MKKTMLSATLVLVMVSLLATSVFPAAFTVNLVGKWEGKISGVSYDPAATPDTQYYKDLAIVIRILSQDGDRFYGEGSVAGKPYKKFTGVIAEGKGVITGKNAVIFVSMPFYEGAAWRMTGHSQASDADGHIDTNKFAVHRTSVTP